MERHARIGLLKRLALGGLLAAGVLLGQHILPGATGPAAFAEKCSRCDFSDEPIVVIGNPKPR
jgi:hypothetical protein